MHLFISFLKNDLEDNNLSADIYPSLNMDVLKSHDEMGKFFKIWVLYF